MLDHHMDCSSTPSMSQKANVDDNVVTPFGRLCINQNGTVSASSVPSSLASSSRSISPGKHGSEDQLLETGVVEEDTKGSSSSSSSSSTMLFPNLQPFPGASSNPQHNIWASPYFYQGGNTMPQNVFDTNYQPGVKSFHPYSAIYGNSGLNYPSRVQNSGFSHVSWADNTTGRANGSYNNPNLALAVAAPSPYYNQQLENSVPRVNFLKMALSSDGSEELRKFLLEGNCIREVLRDVFPAIIQLMTHQYGHRIFEALLQRCEKCDLYAIMKKMISESDSFLRAAFCEAGSRSIQRLIKRLKNTGMEFDITLVLSKFAWQLMTHRIASHVIRHCFLVLTDEPNKVLHDYVFELFLPLAMDPMGCITINACIDGITRWRRAELLNLVAQNASQLSCDPSGNFVVQHVLNLNNDLATEKICRSLEGQFVLLSQKKGGSHVVEKCLQSHFGLSLVMNEIFKDEKTLCMLARDKFGNYVIQKALKLTKIHDRDMYTRLVQVLEFRHPKIVHKVNGKCEQQE